ncbi:MAG: EthD family reductase [Gammaproteobacteria bacterium]
MSDVKLVVIYPRPKDIEVFEKLYQEEHVPMAVEKLSGKTKLIATKVMATPDGAPPPFYRIAEVYFPSLEALQACAQSDGGKETVAHAVKISSGGAPVFLVAEEQTFTFGGSSLLGRLKTLVFP